MKLVHRVQLVPQVLKEIPVLRAIQDYKVILAHKDYKEIQAPQVLMVVTETKVRKVMTVLIVL